MKTVSMSRSQIRLQLLFLSSVLTLVRMLPLQAQIPDVNGWIAYRRADELHYFKLFNEKADFFEAEQNCIIQHGHLASFRDADEYEFIKQMYNNQDQLWLGLYNYNESSPTNLYRFWFTDGCSFDPSAWRDKFPMIFVNKNEREYVSPHDLAVEQNPRLFFCSALAADRPNLWVISVECDERRKAHICKISADSYRWQLIETSTTTKKTTTLLLTTTTTTPETTTTATTTTTKIINLTAGPPENFPVSFNAWAAPAGPSAPEITAINVVPDDECVNYCLFDFTTWDMRVLLRCGWRDLMLALALAIIALALVLTLCCWWCCCWLAGGWHSGEYRIAKAEQTRRRRHNAVYASFNHAPQPGEFLDDGDTTIIDFV